MGVLAHVVLKTPPRKKTGLTGNPKVKWETTKNRKKTGFNWKNRKNGK